MAALSLANPIPVINAVVTDDALVVAENTAKQTTKVVSEAGSVSNAYKLLTDRHSKTLVDRHVRAIHRLVKFNRKGFLMRDVDMVCEMLTICAERLQTESAYEKPLCELINISGETFLKEKSSDEATYADSIVNLLTELGHVLIKVENVQVRLSLTECLMSFYCTDHPERMTVEGYQACSLVFNKKLVERSGVNRALIQCLEVVTNIDVRLDVMRVLQHYSDSVLNCDDMLAVSAAGLICSALNTPDPTGRLIFVSVEILWNLLENGSKKVVSDQLNCFECISALKEAFIRYTREGNSHADRQLRNDLLVITTLVASYCPTAPFVETGFTKLLVLFATFTEVKSHNELVKNLKLYQNHEDFELKKLLMNVLTILVKDKSAVQILSQGRSLLSLFAYVRANDNTTTSTEWSPAQFEELQLQALDTLATIAPKCIEDYMTCQGSTRLLMLLEWCVGQADYGGHGNSYHGTGGRGNKRSQMHYCLRLLRSMCSAGDEAVNQDMVDQGAIHQLVSILLNASTSPDENDAIDIEMQCDMLFILSTLCEGDLHRKDLFGALGVQVVVEYLRKDRNKIRSPLGHHQILLATVDCVWSSVLGCFMTEQLFLENEGVFLLLDLLEVCPDTMQSLVLGCLVDLCENTKALPHISSWRGDSEKTVGKLLIELWKKEEANMGVIRDCNGAILDPKHPISGVVQKRLGVIPLPADRPSQAIVDVPENMRAKIYTMFCKLGFNDVPGLSTVDYVTLAIIEKYLDFKMYEVWGEIKSELEQENIRPISPDVECLTEVTRVLEERTGGVATSQARLLFTHQECHLSDEQQYYETIKDNHKQEEKAFEDFNNFLSRTSDYTVLQAEKQKQLATIENSRLLQRSYNGEILHETLQENLQTTAFCGRRIDIESTPLEITRPVVHPASREQERRQQLIVQ